MTYNEELKMIKDALKILQKEIDFHRDLIAMRKREGNVQAVERYTEEMEKKEILLAKWRKNLEDREREA
jgi:predicted HicB family RNase H-like nuclease